MPTIVTATELRTILGVSSSLYSDAYLGDIVDASENLVLPMLVTFQSKINKVKLTNRNAALSGLSTYVGNPNAEAAILAISVEIFQSRTAAGGSIEGVDFAVTPYRLSKNLLAKVTGLLGPYLDVETMVG